MNEKQNEDILRAPKSIRDILISYVGINVMMFMFCVFIQFIVARGNNTTLSVLEAVEAGFEFYIDSYIYFGSAFILLFWYAYRKRYIIKRAKNINRIRVIKGIIKEEIYQVLNEHNLIENSSPGIGYYQQSDKK